MLVGILVEVVQVVSAVEGERSRLETVKFKIHEILDMNGVDTNGDCMVSRPEFIAMLMNDVATRALIDIGVDVVALVDYVDDIFPEGRTSLSFGDFMDVVLQLRGSNGATVKDIVDLRKHLATSLAAREPQRTCS